MGKKRADTLAKMGTSLPAPCQQAITTKVWFQTQARSQLLQRWKQELPLSNPSFTFPTHMHSIDWQTHVHFGGFSAIDHPLTHTRTTLPTRVHVDRTCIPPTTFYETVPFLRSNVHGCSSQLVATWNLSPSSRIRQIGWAYETFYELRDSTTLKTSLTTDSLHPWREMEPRTWIRLIQTLAPSNHEMINDG